MFIEERKAAGPRLTALEQIADTATTFETSVEIQFDPALTIPINASRKCKLIVVDTKCSRPKIPTTLLELYTFDGYKYSGHVREGMFAFAEICGAGRPFSTRGTINHQSITVKSKGASLAGKALKELALQAWCEAFGVDEPDFKKLKEQADQKKSAGANLKQQLLDALKTGQQGVKKWNEMPGTEKNTCDFKNADLQGVDLTALELNDVDFRASNFDKANLTKATFRGTDIRNCSFRDSVLCNASTGRHSAQFTGCNFSGADMRHSSFNGSWIGCTLDEANFSDAFVNGSGFGKASFRNTNFSNANFGSSDLKGADLSTANLTGAHFEYCFYSSETKWPPGFAKPNGLEFKGGGADPFLLESLNKDKLTGAIDFDALIEQLNQKFDKDRLKKSLKMLKSETFQLFSEVEDNSVVGIVKSQTDPDLVYSCRLTSGGDFPAAPRI